MGDKYIRESAVCPTEHKDAAFDSDFLSFSRLYESILVNMIHIVPFTNYLGNKGHANVVLRILSGE